MAFLKSIDGAVLALLKCIDDSVLDPSGFPQSSPTKVCNKNFHQDSYFNLKICHIVCSQLLHKHIGKDYTLHYYDALNLQIICNMNNAHYEYYLEEKTELIIIQVDRFEYDSSACSRCSFHQPAAPTPQVKLDGLALFVTDPLCDNLYHLLNIPVFQLQP